MQPIERVSQTDMVVKELTRYFLSDEINEGDKLPTEMMLCERLRVGRSTLREAIKAPAYAQQAFPRSARIA